MAGTLHHLQLMGGGIAGEMTHVAGRHHLVRTAGDPQARHGEGMGESGQLAHRAAVGAAGQQAPRRPRVRQQGRPQPCQQGPVGQPPRAQAQQKRSTPPQLAERPRLIHPTSGADLHQPLELLPQVPGRMERHAAPERMAHQHHRLLLSHLLAHPGGHPAAVAGQAGLQAPGTWRGAESRQIGRQQRATRPHLLFQALPEPAREKPAVQGHEHWRKGRVAAQAQPSR